MPLKYMIKTVTVHMSEGSLVRRFTCPNCPIGRLRVGQDGLCIFLLSVTKFKCMSMRSFGYLKLRTCGLSDMQTFGQVNLRTSEPTDKWIFGHVICNLKNRSVHSVEYWTVRRGPMFYQFSGLVLFKYLFVLLLHYLYLLFTSVG